MSQIVKHKRSNSTITSGDVVLPKQPTPAQLADGELAINYSNGHETLFTKNDSGEIVSFSNDAVLLSAIQECENVIESVSLNGNPLPVSNKNVNVTALTAETYTHHETITTTASTASSALTHGGTFTAINQIDINNGHITGYTTETYTLPSGSRTPYVASAAAASVTIDPYKMYDFGTVDRSMTIVFNTSAEESGYTKEYTIRFVAGNGCSITLPNGVLYANHPAPVYTAGHTYEINVVNNCVVVAEFY